MDINSLNHQEVVFAALNYIFDNGLEYFTCSDIVEAVQKTLGNDLSPDIILITLANHTQKNIAALLNTCYFTMDRATNTLKVLPGVTAIYEGDSTRYVVEEDFDEA